MMFSHVIAALGVLGAVLTANAQDWSYDENAPDGPENWAEKYPGCNGNLQSPVDLQGSNSLQFPTLDFSMEWNRAPDNMTIQNTGRTMILSGGGNPPRVTIENRIYQLDHVQFHWGESKENGSEHVFNKKRFALEMQALHNRVKDDGSLVFPPEMITIAALYKEGENESRIIKRNRALDLFLGEADGIVEAGQVVQVKPFAWRELISERKSFYWYRGSLTTPPCTEFVTFYISGKKYTVLTSQMQKFRALLDENQKPISGNFRPLQPVRDRNIYLNTHANTA